MWATSSCRRIAALAFVLSLCSIGTVRAQIVARHDSGSAAALDSLTRWRADCRIDFSPVHAADWHTPNSNPGIVEMMWPASTVDDFDANSGTPSCGSFREPSASGANIEVRPDSSCGPAFRDSACPAVGDPVALQLHSLGKPGLEILRARKAVLDILDSQNACSEWFSTRDPAANLTFRTLGFLVDHEGAEDVLSSVLPDAMTVIRQPYVARATQDGGANTHITVNANGAFYRAQAKLERSSAEGGPAQFGGEHWLTVGVYTGNTQQAQVLTLLHELGHIIDLLPEDSDDLDGKSARNTGEVLRHCRPEIESRVKQAREAAKK